MNYEKDQFKMAGNSEFFFILYSYVPFNPKVILKILQFCYIDNPYNNLYSNNNQTSFVNSVIIYSYSMIFIKLAINCIQNESLKKNCADRKVTGG